MTATAKANRQTCTATRIIGPAHDRTTDNGDEYGARFGVVDTYRDTFTMAFFEDEEVDA